MERVSRAFVFCVIMTAAMSAQDFHGVTVSGSGNRYAIVNHSTKPVIGYAIQGHTATGLGPVSVRVDLVSWAAGKPMQPGEERSIAMFRAASTVGAVPTVTSPKEETISYELTAVLFADGTFYGPDDVLDDFSRQIAALRNLARDSSPSQERISPADMVKAMQNPSTDIQALVQRAELANVISMIREAKGEPEAKAALGRIAALPDVTRGRE